MCLLLQGSEEAEVFPLKADITGGGGEGEHIFLPEIRLLPT